MTVQHSRKRRSSSLDLIKWLAMLTMVIDHLRLVWPDMTNLFIPGRLSFPLFCVAIAANVARSKPGELLTPASGRYLALMLLFAAISEVPYRYISTSGSFNIMVTLALGLVIAWGVQHRTLLSGAMALIALSVAYVLNDSLMYGVYGALVPAAVLLAIKRPGALWLLPAALSLLSNTRSSSIVTKAMGLEVYSLLVLSAAFAAPLIGLWLLRQTFSFKVWPVRRWGYWFYPGHLAALQAIRLLV
ncbi:TraX family protein [Pseudomonas shahriarae]|uniref:Conjugal transfer protein TraX n=1 Tax=Pseudomonas shahriarae TaxID=2745512 RepID=A0ABT5NH17_9PSED|nr:TraX family protein [Pseudomonas shahriarae]MDD0987845.1 conjugal transfer protein TraX [Pseudomonas shahriarae]MDD1032482.1 conjugal transfer protein TraX [Pseudomonas shahriarae]